MHPVLEVGGLAAMLEGLCRSMRAGLSQLSADRALVHLALSVGDLDATLGMLWRCQCAYASAPEPAF